MHRSSGTVLQAEAITNCIDPVLSQCMPMDDCVLRRLGLLQIFSSIMHVSLTG